jgi:hemoglobin-like flavoprotein
MLTHAQKDTIRRTWKLVEPIADSIPDLFYKRLFDIAPQYRSLFSEDLTAQKRKLATMLAFVVKSIDWPEEFWTDRISPDQDLVMVVAALGRRHAQLYRVPDEAYVPVGEALMWALDYALGEAFTGEVRDAWAGLYGVLSKCMIMSRDLAGSGAVATRVAR